MSVALAVLAGLGVAAAFRWAVSTNSYNVWGALIWVPIVIAVNVVLIRRVSRTTDMAWLPGLLGLAYALKLVGALGRYYIAYVVYAGAADAQRYNLYAATHHVQWRGGVISWEWSAKQGTQWMELITTALYTVTGPSPLAAFVIFASFAFWGQYLLFRAFRLALPEGNTKRYAVLVLVLPSLLFWPSSIGKEAWLMFFVGVTALGAARLFTHRRGALVLLLLGAAGTALLRPHLAVLLFAALFVAQLFRPTDDRRSGLLSKMGGVMVLGVAAYILTSQSAAFLGIDDFSWQAVSDTVDSASDQASEGQSAFESTPIRSPADIPGALVTVLFRPFPWEANNAQMLIQSLEGVFLIALTLKAVPRLRRLPSAMARSPYVTFSVVYVSTFVWAFSGFGNFGILARQRVLMIPFFLVLLALPAIDRLREEATAPVRKLDRVRR
ncbi:hypothetical protein [Knoellia aerolata]|uniref:hypothetical protein n=1 Tax=Knoellia aerolata TaxID=442954 RepID=UPI0012EDA368|nr:hypothetical protein [Knoellia aerolata]